jgi:hypothetical protein
MKIHEYILSESVTFFVHKQGENFYDKVTKDCEACDGTGIEDWGDVKHKCRYCNGVGKYETIESRLPDLNVANTNAHVILNMLGIQTGDDTTGTIENNQLPEMKRKLIKLKNTDTSRHTRQYDISGGNTYVDKSGEIPRIGRTGIMHNMGLSNDRIKEYVDDLIKIVDAAQKIGGSVSFA